MWCTFTTLPEEVGDPQDPQPLQPYMMMMLCTTLFVHNNERSSYMNILKTKIFADLGVSQATYLFHRLSMYCTEKVGLLKR